ncbi:MAG: hypothetical protein E4H11_01335 [Myxococcales bacterium]|nr:MAG: hypothetical protein E4H11_01335 [Myxococcales bacterium]
MRGSCARARRPRPRGAAGAAPRLRSRRGGTRRPRGPSGRTADLRAQRADRALPRSAPAASRARAAPLRPLCQARARP